MRLYNSSKSRKQLVFSLLALLGWGVVSFLYLPDTYQAFSFLLLMPWVWSSGSGSLRWVVPLVLVYTLLQHLYPTPNLSIDSLLVTVLPGLIALGFVAWLRERDRLKQKGLEDSLRSMHLLEEASLSISMASDPLELTENAMTYLHNLGVAPHLAFVRFREGKPVVVSARGALERYRGRHLPQQKLSTHASLTDSFTVGNYLEGIPESVGWSTAAVPVSARQKRPLGVVILAREGNKPFQPEEKAIANSLIRVMGAQLGQMEALKQLEDAYDGTLRALGLALEFRDHETQGHTKRVVAWSDQLAQDVGLDASMRKFLRWGAYLHDIGKLSIPDNILRKPDKLNDEEWEIMKSHVVRGWEMLSRVPFLPQETLEVVRHHHENWDGSGYPDGLKGQDIPILARIFAVVDTFDALYSPRPYKRAWKPAEIIEELNRLKGKKLDPKLVDIFIKRITSPSGKEAMEVANPSKAGFKA
ncbi:metal dependent phosphohydrolase [Meiothermus taiwanensis WR-220]|jgi:putative nucleotidyltransferase with HDIG domain|uniref:3'3'-cGAMP-specific phosphodiesterase 2 n=2 Tax=Meiothermus taiwanensis TaxID=172827 RepID=A0A399E6C5_9DEIN|nr:metal dependent phosphohydrolase [Meiothermus taiwanensis WR-220]KIQ55293.1 metal-dependent phosphohydrolase [Meiothermus taiwanensis]KZK16769.1 metal-dependent phosphohydrolase [Meiothermus taiwanensis]RIH79053.1 3'3'-cGAMP-specific phosphodiesterase 2 [Meiothermus taiwanensis]